VAKGPLDFDQGWSDANALIEAVALYRVHFLDYGDNVRATHHVEHDNDAAAIEAAHRLNVLPHMNPCFEVWDDERLVHRHRN